MTLPGPGRVGGDAPLPFSSSPSPSFWSLELRVPPPLGALATGLGMWGLAGWLPPPVALPLPLPFGVRLVLSATLSVSGGVLALAAMLAFRRRRTTIDPLHPGRVTALVTHGPYAVSRNPMYLGLVAVLLGWWLRLDAWPALLGPVGFWGYVGRFQIVPEERVLAARFGPAFAAYRARVRRWL